MRNSILDLVSIASKTLPKPATVYEFGSRQVEGGGGAMADLRGFFPDSKYIGLDIEPGPGVDAIYPKDTYGLHGIADACLCVEVLEHAKDPEGLVSTISRMLTQGYRGPSWALFTAPFNFPVHSEPDYRRYTPAGMKLLLDKCFWKDEAYILPTLPRAMPVTVAALAWHNLDARPLAQFKIAAEAWCQRWAHPIGPKSGDSVFLCAHAGSDKFTPWSFLAEPVQLEIPTQGGPNRIVSSRWWGLCMECKEKSNGVLDVKLIDRDGVIR